MIKGHKREELSADNILAKVSELLIYRHYFGQFELNETTYNHLRGEDTSSCPSFIISNRYGHLHHKDFAMGDDWSGNCFKLVQQIHGCSYNEALKIIDRDLGLGILPEHNSGIYRKLKKELKVPDEISKRYSLIQVVTRKFTKEELSYWQEYGQSLEDLKANHIYSIKEMYLNKKRHPLADLRFGYLYDGYWKIYSPYEDKKRKWISNVPLTMTRGLNNLSPDKNTLICKSLKDYMVCRKVYSNVCHVQNESKSAFSEETVKFIKANSKDVFYGGDSDDPGKKASYEITRSFGFKHINPPDNLLCEYNAKDFADWARCEGLDAIEKHFKLKKLII